MININIIMLLNTFSPEKLNNLRPFIEGEGDFVAFLA